MKETMKVIQETKILGKKIQMYGNIETPLFKATDVAEWIEHSKVSVMLKTVDENEKVKVNNVYSEKRTGGNGTWMLTEDGLYEVCMQSRKPIAKQMKKEIKQYLKSIRLTGVVIPVGREEEMVNTDYKSSSNHLHMNAIKKVFDGRDVIMYQDLNHDLWFEIESLSMAIGYITKAKGKEYVHKSRMNKTLKNAEISTVVHGVQQWITEQQMYEFLIEAHTEKSKTFKRWLSKEVLPTIEKTGGYIENGREEEMVNYYFSNLSSELQGEIVNELMKKNIELQQFYDDLMNTEGVYSMNTTAKELGVGRNTLFSYLREKSIMFYQDNINIPYQRYMNQGLFKVIESPCADGKYRPTTYVTKKGLDYIRRMLDKEYLEVAS